MIVEIEHLNPCNMAYAVGLAKELHGLGTFGADGPDFNWEFCKNTMTRIMQDPNHYFRLARDDTGYVGAVVGYVVPHFFSAEMMGIEEAWFVRLDTVNRASVGMKLMRGFVEWCINEKRALSVQSGDIASIQSVGVDALYRRMGFARLGVIYKFARA